MTTFGRSYEKENKGNYAAGTTALLAVLHAIERNLNPGGPGLHFLCAGDYRPEAENERF